MKLAGLFFPSRWSGFPSGGYGGWMPDHLHLITMAACIETGAVQMDGEGHPRSRFYVLVSSMPTTWDTSCASEI